MEIYKGRAKLIEQVNFKLEVAERAKPLLESALETLPSVIYPEIHAITADRPSRNKTYYPLASLQGDAAKNSGWRSALFPYPIPILKDHLLSPNPYTGHASKVYGRVRHARLVTQPGCSYISLIPAITDPEAIEGVLSGTWLTTSIGIETESVHCSICNTNLMKSECEHRKGEVYDGKECWWVIGPIYFQENSFVVQPSDINARVIDPNVSPDKLRVLMGESAHLIDLTTGYTLRTNFKLKEHYMLEHPLAALYDPARHITVGLDLSESETQVLTFGEAVQNDILAQLARANAIDGVTPATTENTIQIDITSENYSGLFSVIDVLTARAQDLKSNSEAFKTEAQEAKVKLGVLETKISELETSKTEAISALESMRTQIESLKEEMTKSETQSLNEAKLRIEAANTKTESMAAQNKAIQSELSKHMEFSHERLASQVALLKKHLNRASAKNKSVESLTAEYKERTESSLKDDLTELLAELDWSPKADPTTPVVPNPLAVNKEQLANNIQVEETEEDEILWFNGKAARKPDFTKAMEAFDSHLAKLKQG